MWIMNIGQYKSSELLRIKKISIYYNDLLDDNK